LSQLCYNFLLFYFFFYNCCFFLVCLNFSLSSAPARRKQIIVKYYGKNNAKVPPLRLYSSFTALLTTYILTKFLCLPQLCYNFLLFYFFLYNCCFFLVCSNFSLSSAPARRKQIIVKYYGKNNAEVPPLRLCSSFTALLTTYILTKFLCLSQLCYNFLLFYFFFYNCCFFLVCSNFSLSSAPARRKQIIVKYQGKDNAEVPPLRLYQIYNTLASKSNFPSSSSPRWGEDR